MSKRGVVSLVALSVLLASTGFSHAQALPTSGLYRIVSGSYKECCNFAGNEDIYDLPNAEQSYIQLTIDPQNTSATMTSLGEDTRTIFTKPLCPGPTTFPLSYSLGMVLTGSIIFHADPGQPPNALYWNYTVSNSVSGLRVNGMLGIAQSLCLDVPTRFSHTDVVATLVALPKLSIQGVTQDHRLRLMLQGRAGQTNVIEASTDLVTWAPVSTNVMDYSSCPICPYVLYDDTIDTNQAQRFYRAFEVR